MKQQDLLAISRQCVSGVLAYAVGKVASDNVFAVASVSDLKKHI